MKTKEELLWAEIQSLRDVLLKIIQWGVSVLVAVQTALYFVRRDVIKSLIDREMGPTDTVKEAVARLVNTGKLSDGALLPWPRYIAGTSFLLAVALIFAGITIYGTKQYRHYKAELSTCSGAQVTVATFHRTPRRLIFLMFLFFPAFDVLVRLFLPHA